MSSAGDVACSTQASSMIRSFARAMITVPPTRVHENSGDKLGNPLPAIAPIKPSTRVVRA